MGEATPDLRMMNLVVGDMASSVEFYRRLGVTVPDGEAASGAHVQLRMPSGFSLELDTGESASWWHAGWRADPGSVAVVVCFALDSREAVDATYADLTGAGSRRPSAAVRRVLGRAVGRSWRTLTGNDVGLMSPMDDARRFWPPTESPDP